MKGIALDTGPLVAWFCIKDSHHDWATRTFDGIPSGALICEAVLTETCHLVAKEGIPPTRVLRLVEQNDLIAGETVAIRALMERYADTPMDFADACVVRLAELYADTAVCTTDTDFLVYRQHHTKPISLIAPFSP